MTIPFQAYFCITRYKLEEIALLPYEIVVKSDYTDYAFVESYNEYSQLLLF